MRPSASVVPLAEHEAIIGQIVDLLRGDPSDVQAASYVLSLVEEHVVSAEVARELHKEAILRMYLRQTSQ